MALLRCIDQAPKEFSETYAGLAQANTVLARRAEGMMQLIASLDTSFEEFDVYGYTSHGDLRLVSGTKVEGKPCVLIASYGGDAYSISYPMPESANPPWPNAIVRGEVNGLTEVTKMVIQAMLRSEGWLHRAEVTSLLASMLGSN